MILAFLLGTLGIHNFYLGYTNKGIAQLLLTLLGGWLCGAGAIAAGILGAGRGNSAFDRINSSGCQRCAAEK